MYDGEVTVGGPAQRRELGALTITKVAVGRMNNNAYVLESAGSVLMIDAADEAATLLALLPGGRLDTVVTTHQHPDHWQALTKVAAATGAQTAAHPLDAGRIPVATTHLLDDGDTIAVGSQQLTAIHLVGHTPGSIALLWTAPDGVPHLFTGDALAVSTRAGPTVTA